MNNIEKKEFDIIIIGGGPAGSVAGLYAARNGLKTLLLEKEKFPRDKVCGDALSGKSVMILRDLNLLDKIQELPGAYIQNIIFSSPNHYYFNIDLKKTKLKETPKGFVIRRKIFDQFLFNLAKKNVSDYIEGFNVTGIISENGQVCGIKGIDQNNGKLRQYRAKIVLGADGYRSIISRELGFHRHDPEHTVVALRCYYKNVNDLTDQIELHYIDEVIPGYFWIFPVENGFANVGIGMLHKYIKKKNVNLKKAFYNALNSPYFKARFENASPLENPVGWNLPVGSTHRKIHGNGFLLLGDAAGLIDPFTGEGIGNALFSAKYAIETVSEAIKANEFSEEFLSRYDYRLWDAIGDELKVSTKLQKLGRIRFLLNLVVKKAANSPDVSNIIAGMLANEIPRKHLANPLFYLRLLFS
jgi:geranylgeranyl reductase family protein